MKPMAGSGRIEAMRSLLVKRLRLWSFVDAMAFTSFHTLDP